MTWLHLFLRTAACSFVPNTAPEQWVLASWVVLVYAALATVNCVGKSCLRVSGDGSMARVAMCCHRPWLGDGWLADRAAGDPCELGEPGEPPRACPPG